MSLVWEAHIGASFKPSQQNRVDDWSYLREEDVTGRKLWSGTRDATKSAMVLQVSNL